MTKRPQELRPAAITLNPTNRIGRVGAADQIIEDLRDQIARGVIAHGSRLPSERDLAEQYGVSAPTAREAIRALAAMGLVEVRHGSGSYVVADAGLLVTAAFATALQIEGISITEILELLALINERAASLAVERAETADLEKMAAAEVTIATGKSPMEILSGVGDFLTALVKSAHSPILDLIGPFLIRLLTKMQIDLFPRDQRFWEQLTGPQDAERNEIIQALRDRDADRARDAVRRYHQRAVQRMRDEPASRDAKVSDPRFAAVVADLITDQR